MQETKKQTTTITYEAPRSISIGDIFYVISQREYQKFTSPCHR